MRDDEVGVRDLPVEREGGEEDPRETPTAPSANSIAESRITLPRQVVAIQLKILIPVGTAIAIDESMKKMLSPVGSPTENMWCAQTSIE